MNGTNPYEGEAFRSLFDSLDLPIEEAAPKVEPPAVDDLSDAFSFLFDEAPPKSTAEVGPVEKTSFKGPPDADAHARAEYDKFKTSTRPEERRAIADGLAKYSKHHTDTIEPRALVGRMYLELERTRLAQVALKMAHEAAPDRSDVLADLRIANSRLEAVRIRSAPQQESVSDDLLSLGELEEKQRLAQFKRRDQYAIIAAIAVAIAMVAGLHYGSIEAQLGRGEHAGDLRHLFYWMRIGVLLLLSVFGLLVMTRHRPLRAFDFTIDPKPIAAAVLAGAILGGATPISVATSDVALRLVAVILEVSAAELFFRAFLGRVLHRGLVGDVVPVIAGGLLYAAFQLTYLDNDLKLAHLGSGLTIAGLALLWGLTLAAVHKKTNSLVAVAACCLTARVIVLVAALP